jgi:hypothetical protein
MFFDDPFSDNGTFEACPRGANERFRYKSKDCFASLTMIVGPGYFSIGTFTRRLWWRSPHLTAHSLPVSQK